MRSGIGAMRVVWDQGEPDLLDIELVLDPVQDVVPDEALAAHAEEGAALVLRLRPISSGWS